MFSAGSNLKDKSPEEIFYQDYKKFIGEGNVSFGVGQISSMDSEELKEIKEKLMPFMVSECGRHDITRVYFMLTNILEESTELLFYGEGSQQMAEIAFERETGWRYFLPERRGIQKETADPGYDGGCSAYEQRLRIRRPEKWRNRSGSREI